MSSDTAALVVRAVERFQGEVPALDELKAPLIILTLPSGLVLHLVCLASFLLRALLGGLGLLLVS